MAMRKAAIVVWMRFIEASPVGEGMVASGPDALAPSRPAWGRRPSESRRCGPCSDAGPPAAPTGRQAGLAQVRPAGHDALGVGSLMPGNVASCAASAPLMSIRLAWRRRAGLAAAVGLEQLGRAEAPPWATQPRRRGPGPAAGILLRRSGVSIPGLHLHSLARQVTWLIGRAPPDVADAAGVVADHAGLQRAQARCCAARRSSRRCRACAPACVLSWHEKQAVVIGEVTSVVPAAAVVACVAALNEKPAPWSNTLSATTYGEIAKADTGLADAVFVELAGGLGPVQPVVHRRLRGRQREVVRVRHVAGLAVPQHPGRSCRRTTRSWWRHAR